MPIDVENLGQCEMAIMDLDELNPADYNPRTISDDSRKALKKSIEQFGIVIPILWNKQTGNIVGGHQRYFILKEMGITKTTVAITDMPMSEEKACNIALNSQHLTGDFITDQTRDLLNYVREEQPQIYDDLNFDILQEMMVDVTPSQPRDKNEDDVPDENPASVIVKKGEIWKLGTHRLICGDSTNPEDVKRLMNGETAKMTFTSPPYNGNTTTMIKGKTVELYRDNETDNKTSDEYMDFLDKVLKNIMDNSKGFCFWNINYNKKSKFEFLKTTYKYLEYLDEFICWKKGHALPTGGGLVRIWEPIFVFNFGDEGYLGKQHGGVSNLWEVSNANAQNENHKACYPVDLVVRGIKMASQCGEIVFEPFAGAGTDFIACEKTDRRCYGIELDPVYCDLIIRRWEEYSGKKAELLDPALDNVEAK